MKLLVTGGAGYIGSHACVEFLQVGHDVVVVDNLSNSSKESIKRVEGITKRKVVFYHADLLDKKAMLKIFKKNKFDAVVHFAGLKAVGESVQFPLKYYQNNIIGSLVLFELMVEFGVAKIIFSSSATVYGNPSRVPITENSPLSPTNPYGRTKLMIEQILRDMQNANPSWSVVILRYFNPVGAHSSGQIGEDPNGIPNNLMPYISQVASGKLKELKIFGNDYKTRDGTGVRDYIHVVDLARGHLSALSKCNERNGVFVYNLGTGNGYSVLEVLKTFEKASDRKIPYKFVERRSGDVAECYADPSKANKELGWKAEYGLKEMCADAWRWQSNNPNGYSKK